MYAKSEIGFIKEDFCTILSEWFEECEIVVIDSNFTYVNRWHIVFDKIFDLQELKTILDSYKSDNININLDNSFVNWSGNIKLGSLKNFLDIADNNILDNKYITSIIFYYKDILEDNYNNILNNEYIILKNVTEETLNPEKHIIQFADRKQSIYELEFLNDKKLYAKYKLCSGDNIYCYETKPFIKIINFFMDIRK